VDGSWGKLTHRVGLHLTAKVVLLSLPGIYFLPSMSQLL